MEFLKLAGERYSCRKFSDRPVEQEKINSILAAAGIAPTAKNYQPFKIYLLKSSQAVEKIQSITKMTFKAPVVYLLCTVKEEAWVNEFNPEFNSADLDTGIVITHMLLEAQSQGLGSLCACWFDQTAVKEAYALPDGIQPVALVSVGYPAESAHPAKLHFQKKDLSAIISEL